MVYKCKRDYDRAVLQFVGDQMMSGKSKVRAIEAAQDKFYIGSPATVYLCIRRARMHWEREHSEQAYGKWTAKSEQNGQVQRKGNGATSRHRRKDLVATYEGSVYHLREAKM